MNEKFYWYKRGREDKLEARIEKIKNYPEAKQKKILLLLKIFQLICLLGLSLMSIFKKTLFENPPLYLALVLLLLFLSSAIEHWVRSIYGEDEKIMRPFTYIQGAIWGWVIFASV